MTKVSELLALKIENVVLKLQQVRTQAATLEVEQNKLILEACQEVGVPTDYVFDINARTFSPPNAPKPLSAPAKRAIKRVK